MHIRRERDRVFFDEKPRRLHSQNQILAGNHLRRAVANASAGGHRPDVDFPRRQRFWHVEFNFRNAIVVGFECPDPQGRVREIRAHGRFDQICYSTSNAGFHFHTALIQHDGGIHRGYLSRLHWRGSECEFVHGHIFRNNGSAHSSAETAAQAAPKPG